MKRAKRTTIEAQKSYEEACSEFALQKARLLRMLESYNEESNSTAGNE